MKKIFPFLGLCLLLASCSDLLEEAPKDRLSLSNFYKTKEDAQAAVFAIYDPLRMTDCYGGRYPNQFMPLEDYATGRGAYTPVAEYQGLPGTNIGWTDSMWRLFYQSINMANEVLKNVPQVVMADADKNALLAEARFLRALCYYNLVRNWGPVPIRSAPLNGLDNIGAKRASTDEVYQFIIEDLQYAETNLPATAAQAGRPSLWAAKTLLADVYLTNEKWAEARDKADEVIGSGKFALVPVSKAEDFEKIYGAEVTTTPEEIFYIKFLRVNGEGSWFVNFLHQSNSAYAAAGYATFYALPHFPLIRNWDERDLRKKFNLYTQYPNKQGTLVQAPSITPILFGKFKDRAAPSTNTHGNDFPVLRYADALLIYAEAASQAQGGPTALALERLNMVRRRGYGLPVATPAAEVDISLGNLTAAAFRDLVLTERAYEFMCEGKRWYDLKRIGKVKETIKAAKGIDVAEAHLLNPIPVQEIDNNPGIGPQDQNPGY